MASRFDHVAAAGRRRDHQKESAAPVRGEQPESDTEERHSQDEGWDDRKDHAARHPPDGAELGKPGVPGLQRITPSAPRDLSVVQPGSFGRQERLLVGRHRGARREVGSGS